MIFLGSVFFWNTVHTTCLSTHSINDPVSLGISFSTLHNTHKKRKWKIVAIAQGKTIGRKHGLRTPRDTFFQDLKLLGLGRQIGLIFLRHLRYFWPTYQHYLGTVSPLSMGKFIWFISLQKTLVFRSKTYNSQITPKYDTVKNLEKDYSHFRLR